MCAMTPRQRVITALNRQVPDRVPFELSFGSFTPALLDTFIAKTGAEDPAEYWNYPVRSVAHRGRPQHELWRTYAAYYPDEMPVGTALSPFGVAAVPGSFLHFTSKVHPLRQATTLEEAVDYPLPDPANPARHAHLKTAVAYCSPRPTSSNPMCRGRTWWLFSPRSR